MQRVPGPRSLADNVLRRAAALAAPRLPLVPLPVVVALAAAVVVVVELTLQRPQPAAVVALITRTP